ncbi:MAG: hypothetical protein HYY92_03725 [Parcubacteria group bacterium]|nr:hypothetical protein [Parcubacteria group bacterium]
MVAMTPTRDQKSGVFADDDGVDVGGGGGGGITDAAAGGIMGGFMDGIMGGFICVVGCGGITDCSLVFSGDDGAATDGSAFIIGGSSRVVGSGGF